MYAMSSTPIDLHRPLHPDFDLVLRRRAILPLAAAITLFLIDVRTPNGVVDGFQYVFVILLCWWIPSARAAPLMAFTLMPIMLFGYMLSAMAVPTWMAVTNRVVAAATVWVTALLVWYSARSRLAQTSSLSQSEARLEALITTLNDDRQALSRWLHDDVELELRMVEWRLNRLQHCGTGSADLRTESLILRQAVQRAREAVLAQAARLESV
jgi:hypothetical protein